VCGSGDGLEIHQLKRYLIAPAHGAWKLKCERDAFSLRVIEFDWSRGGSPGRGLSPNHALAEPCPTARWAVVERKSARWAHTAAVAPARSPARTGGSAS